MYGVLAAETADGGGQPGLYLLAFGVFSTAVGGLTVANFRGFADRCVARGHGRRIPPALVRLLGGVFAVAGAVTLVLGVRQVARGELGSFHRTTAVAPLPVAVFALVVMSLAMTRVWRRDDRLRRAWTAGGLRRSCTVLLSLSILGFVACTLLGYAGVGYVFWGTGALAGITVLMKDAGDVEEEHEPS